MKKIFLSLPVIFLFSACSSNKQTTTAESTTQTTAKEIIPESAPLTVAAEKANVKGLTIKVIKQGKGDAIKNFEKAKVHYTGKLTNGKVFDSSRKHNQPFEFVVGAGQVIKGWDLGVEGMKVGEVRKLTIASQLAYGDQGAAGVIPPKATLIFDVELLAIEK